MPTTSSEALLTAQSMVAALKASGLPIAALADILDVERSTVYAWLDRGVDADRASHARLGLVHGLLAREADGFLRFYHRFWLREPGGTISLQSALKSPTISAHAVTSALDALRPAVAQSMQAAQNGAVAPCRSPASLLSIHLVAGRAA